MRIIAYIFLVLCILVSNNTLSEGFSENTKVYTPSGIKCIQDIRVGDKVINFNKNTQEYTQGKVAAIAKKPTKSLMRLKIGSEIIQVHARQKFLNALTQKWCHARDITPGQKLVARDGKPLIVDEVYQEKISGNTHTLAINKDTAPPNYCIGESKIVAHNMAFVLPAAPIVGSVAAEVGAGVATMGAAAVETVTVGATALANTSVVTALHTTASAATAAIYSAGSAAAGWAAGLFGTTASGTTAAGMSAAGKASLLTLAKAKVGITITPAMKAKAQQFLMTQAATVVNTATTAATTASPLTTAVTAASATTAPITTAATASVTAATVSAPVATTTTAAAVTTPVAAKTTTVIAAKVATAAKAATIAKTCVVAGSAPIALVATKGAVVTAVEKSSRIRQGIQRVRNWWRGGSDDAGKMKMLGVAGLRKATEFMHFANNGNNQPIPQSLKSPPGTPGGGFDPEDIVKKALEWIMKQKPNANGENNKLNHFFGQNGKHRLDFLVKQFGTQEAAVLAVLKELVVTQGLPLSGTFKDIAVQVCGRTIEVSGAVINGVPLIGTMALARNAIL